jgi:2-(1,2-epoxy-1,2-dihydrophenyl)acetyl-CoA isomerase
MADRHSSIAVTSDADAVATITLEAPALTEAAKRGLRDALADVAADETVRAVVLTGSGTVFCAGQDLREHAAALGVEGRDPFDTLAEHYNPAVTLLAAMPKPVIAAVNGTCAGAGLSLALACDLRVAAAGARFATAFTGIGLAPDSGLSATLSRAVGYARASELVLLNEPFTAEQALDWGLVGRVVPAGELAATVAAMASCLAAGPTRAYAVAKRTMREAWAAPLREVLAAEVADQSALGATKDHRGAVEAFVAKETPRFSGQ